jgi:hypothetical protein
MDLRQNAIDLRSTRQRRMLPGCDRQDHQAKHQIFTRAETFGSYFDAPVDMAFQGSDCRQFLVSFTLLTYLQANRLPIYNSSLQGGAYLPDQPI